MSDNCMELVKKWEDRTRTAEARVKELEDAYEQSGRDIEAYSENLTKAEAGQAVLDDALEKITKLGGTQTTITRARFIAREARAQLAERAKAVMAEKEQAVSDKTIRISGRSCLGLSNNIGTSSPKSSAKPDDVTEAEARGLEMAARYLDNRAGDVDGLTDGLLGRRYRADARAVRAMKDSPGGSDAK